MIATAEKKEAGICKAGASFNRFSFDTSVHIASCEKRKPRSRFGRSNTDDSGRKHEASHVPQAFRRELPVEPLQPRPLLQKCACAVRRWTDRVQFLQCLPIIETLRFGDGERIGAESAADQSPY